MNALSLVLCLRYLFKKKLVFFSVAAVGMSCGLLIVISSLFSGYIEALETGATRYIGQVVLSRGGGVVIEQYPELIKRLEADSRIEAATGVLSSQGMALLGKGNVRAVSIWGIDLPGRAKVTPFGEALVARGGGEGAFGDKVQQREVEMDPEAVDFSVPGQEDERGCFLSVGVVARPGELTDTYDRDEVMEAVGQRVLLTSGSLEQQRPRSMRFTVSDVVFTGLSDFDESFVYVPIDVMGEVLYPESKQPAHVVHVKGAEGVSDEELMAACHEIWNMFTGEVYGSDYWGRWVEVESSREMQAMLVREYRKQMGVLMFIFAIVSGGVVLLVFCIFYMIVLTQRKDIAILKSCGMSGWGAMMIFVLFGAVIGVAGSGLGVGVGLIVTDNINTIEQWISYALGMKMWQSSTYMFSQIPVRVMWGDVLWIVCSSIGAAVLGAMIPAVQAGRVDPVKILRYE